jgi:hypothetical protein
MQTMTVRYSTRALLGVATVASLSLYGTFSFYSRQTERNLIQKDAFQIGAEEQHFEALKRDLPSDAVVGYVSDLNEAGIQLAAQYALIPILLVDRPPGDLVVGSFSRPMDYAAFGRAHGLQLIKDYGFGVTLFRKIGK